MMAAFSSEISGVLRKAHPERIGGQQFLMLPIEAGAFNMGDERGDLFEDTRPVHPVFVSDFYLAQYPVTQALWRAVADLSEGSLDLYPSRFKGDQLPVENVSWGEAKIFLAILNLRTKDSRPPEYEYRLPTEAQWEYAARGGCYHGDNFKYAGGDRLQDCGWFAENNEMATRPVGLKAPNQLGLFDMCGNVWEWCEDWYGGKEYYEACNNLNQVVENPKGPESGTNRVRRGGRWGNTAQLCRAAFRNLWLPDTRSDNLGFRLCLSLSSVD